MMGQIIQLGICVTPWKMYAVCVYLTVHIKLSNCFITFSGLVLEPKKKYSQAAVELPFHVSMAALDIQNCDPNGEELLGVQSDTSQHSHALILTLF